MANVCGTGPVAQLRTTKNVHALFPIEQVENITGCVSHNILMVGATELVTQTACARPNKPTFDGQTVINQSLAILLFIYF